LDAMDECTLRASVMNIGIFARVSPHHKLRIVRALKQQGACVAMTGDGVNDALALREADVGLAMGITGTDVAKEAADMVIQDDNFATIVHGIEEGRAVHDHITKFVLYLLSGNLAEILVLGCGFFFPFWSPHSAAAILLPAQILWVNLVTDGLPALAFGLDPLSPKAMEHPPRSARLPILSKARVFYITIAALLLSASVLLAATWGFRRSMALGQTMGFSSLVFLELIKGQIIRKRFHLSWKSNTWMLLAWGTSAVLQLGAIYLPGLQSAMHTVPLDLKAWLVLSLVCLSFFLASKWIGKNLKMT